MDMAVDVRAANALARLRSAKSWLRLQDTSLQKRMGFQLRRGALVRTLLWVAAGAGVAMSLIQMFWPYDPSLPSATWFLPSRSLPFLWLALFAGVGCAIAAIVQRRSVAPLESAFERLIVASERFQNAERILAEAERALEDALAAFSSQDAQRDDVFRS